MRFPTDLVVDVWIAVSLLAAAGLYVLMERRAVPHGPTRPHPWRRRYFIAGLAAILVALEPPVDLGAERSLSIHMVQHLLLTMVAAPLLVLGAPAMLALRASRGTTRRRLRAGLDSAPVRVLASPLVAWSLLVGVLWASHLSGLYDEALRSRGVHAMEHLMYLGAALLFWLPVVGVDAAPSRLSHPARIFYLFLAMPAMAFLGVAIFSARHILYPSYAAVEGLSDALADQRAAGALMWNGGMFLIVPAMAFVLFDWMRADEREARNVDRRLLRASSQERRGAS